MKISISKFPRISVLIMILAALAPRCSGQDLGAATRVSTVPPGLYFSVDGQTLPVRHDCRMAQRQQTYVAGVSAHASSWAKRNLFSRDWEFAGGTFSGNPVIITADPAVPEYQAVFDTQYDLSLLFYACGDPVACQYSPGVIYVGSVAYNSDQDIWTGAGGTVTLLAMPNPGYVFGGWLPGPNQVIQGFQDTVTMSSPDFGFPDVSGGAPH